MGFACFLVPPPTTPTHVEGICPPGWTSWGSDCYAFSANNNDKVDTSDNAQLKCNQLGGNLASIHTMAENQFIYESLMARNLTDFNMYAHIGLRQPAGGSS
jgi:hypothetical protein